MLHISFICIGKLNARYYAEGVADYAKRLGAFCRFRVIELAEEPLREKGLSPANVEQALQKEAGRVLAAVPKGARLVALCIEGSALSSQELAGQLSAWCAAGVSQVAFVIGSSHGLHSSVSQKADFRLSLSRLTLPHQLARLVLAEQVYRAFSILGGTKYHK